MSFAASDSHLALLLTEALRREGIDVWLDANETFAGDPIRDQVEVGIAGADVAVLIANHSALESEAVQREWRKAAASAARVVLVLGHDSHYEDVPVAFRHVQAIRLATSDASEIRSLAERIARVEVEQRSDSPRRVVYLDRPYPALRHSILSASRRIDFASASMSGVFGAVAALLPEATHRPEIRVLLPDPDFLEMEEGGHDLEAASLSRRALAVMRSLRRDLLSLRLRQGPIIQSILLADDEGFIDPLPSTPQVGGLLQVSRSRSGSTLFAAAESTFDSAFSQARPDSTHESKLERQKFAFLLESGDPHDFEYAAELYFRSRGDYHVSRGLSLSDSGYDLALVDDRGDVRIVEAKNTRTRIGIKSVQRLVEAAKKVGALEAFLFTSASLSSEAHRFVEEINVLGGPPRVTVVSVSDVTRELSVS